MEMISFISSASFIFRFECTRRRPVASSVRLRAKRSNQDKKVQKSPKERRNEASNPHLQPVVVVHHRRHAVEAVAVELVLLHPPARVGDEEAESLPVAVVEASAVRSVGGGELFEVFCVFCKRSKKSELKKFCFPVQRKKKRKKMQTFLPHLSHIQW